MQPASVVPFPAPVAFPDPLGTRLVISDRPGERLEQLRFAPRLLSAGFEASLRERAAQLAQFRHPCYARVRRIDRLEGGAALAVVSDHPQGARLSDVLAVAERDGLDLDINAALCVVQQLVPAIAALHQAVRGVAHGALSPDRIIVTPHARIVITEQVVGSAIEGLGLSRSELWRDLRILTPPPSPDGTPRLDRRADIVQIGAVSLALVLGRPLGADELDALPDLLASARETTVLGRRELVAAPLRRWLRRLLHLDPRGSFQSAAEAQEGLEDVLSEEGGYIAAPIALEAFLARYRERAATPVPSAPPVSARPAPVPAKPSAQGVPIQLLAAPPDQPAGPQGADAATLGEGDQPRLLAAAPPVAPASGEVPPAMIPPFAVPGDQPAVPLPADADGMQPGERTELRQFLEEMDSNRVPAERMAAPDVAPEDHADLAPQEPMPDSYVISTPVRRFTRERLALLLCAAVALGEAAYIWMSRPAFVTAPSEGRLLIDSHPTGAAVVIDDRERGVTPLSLSLGSGAHVLSLRTPTSSRAVPITIQAGMTYAHYLELAPSVTTGAIDVLVEQPGARVLLDGEPRGVSPVTIADVRPGEHELVIEAPTGVVRQRVVVESGLTTSVRPATPEAPRAAAPATGWVAIQVPFEMQVFEYDRPIGTTASPRLRLAPGRHQLQIVSEALAFRTTATVDVVAGQEVRVPVQLPKGSVAINATPWAEVWIDGQKAGETPIGSVALAVGPHELLFKHPDYPDYRHAVSVRAGAPTRVSVEMKR